MAAVNFCHGYTVGTYAYYRGVAAADPDVESILLRIDSPGGTAAGTAELALEVRAAAKKKTTCKF